MADKPTAIPGAKIRRIRKRDYLVIDLKIFMGGGEVSIEDLAKRVHLQPETVLDCLLNYKTNAHLIKALYDEQVAKAWKDHEDARGELKKRSLNPYADDDTNGRMIDAFLRWTIFIDKPIVLTLSPGFKDVLSKAAVKRSRQSRIKTVTPDLKKLEKELVDIHVEAAVLRTWLKTFETWTKDAVAEMWMLEAMTGLIQAQLKHPQSSVSSGDRTGMEQFQGKFDRLKTEAYKNMVHNPPQEADTISRRNKTAKVLLGMLENRSFVDHIQVLVDNRDIAPATLWRDACEAHLLAFVALLMSPEAENVVNRHVLPMIQLLASKEFDVSGLSASNYPFFQQAALTAPPKPSTNSTLATIAGFAALVPQAVGKLPGPNSLAVGVLEVAAPIIMTHVIRNVEEAGRISGWFYRALTNSAGLNMPQRVELIEAVNNGDLKKVRSIKWKSRFMQSPAWGAAVGVASAICMIAAIQSDDENTVRRWSNIVGGASGAALGFGTALAKALKNYASLMKYGMLGKVGGPILGIVGGIAAIASGYITAKEEYKSGDQFGRWISLGGAVGGGMSVAGFLVAGGAAVIGGTGGLGTVVGGILMVAGVAVGLVAGIIGVIRDLTTAGSHKSFESFFNHFGRTGGPCNRAQIYSPSLKAAYNTIKSDHHSVDFWDVNPARIPELGYLGFSSEHIALIVDMDESEVKKKLKK